MAQERWLVVFSGRVQGVGFRQTTVDLAADLPLGGTVRNVPERRVELVVQGPSAAVAELLRRLGEHFGTFIRNIERTPLPPEETSRGIRITW